MVGTLNFSLLQNTLFWESDNVIDMNYFGFSHQILQLKLLANHIKDQVIMIHFKFYIIFLKEFSCNMIWWRPRIKIHIPTAQLWLEIYSLKLPLVCMPTQKKVANLKFLVHPFD